jgi:hypothetical protein
LGGTTAIGPSAFKNANSDAARKSESSTSGIRILVNRNTPTLVSTPIAV